MKKKLFLWLMLLFASMSGFGQTIVEVGSGNSLTDNARIPTNLYYNYSVSQVIYLASEINESGNITSISFYNTYAGLNLDRTVTVYMAETELSSFSSSNDALPASSFTEVFQGTWNVTGQNWSEILLDTPFPYSGSDNLVIAVVDETGSYDGSGRYWRSTTGTGRALNACQDGNAYNFGGSVSYTTYNYFPDIQMTISTGGTVCDNLPAMPTASNLASDGVTVSWQDVAAGESYEVQYKTSSQSWDDYDVVSTTVTSYSIDLTGLNPATTYNIRVRHLCSDGSASSWRSLTVVTLCAPISQLPYIQDFENYPSSGNPMPYCWERMGTSTTYPYVYSSSYSSHAGNGCLYFYPYGANIAVLPEFADALNTLRITFWMHPGGTGTNYGTMDVGFLQNPSDTSTFETVASFPATSLTSSYARYVVDFDNATVTDSSRIAFRCRVDNGYGWYVDDLVVNTIPSCQEPPFLSLQATGVGSSSIDLVWQDPNNSSWNIYYKEAGSSDDFGTEVSIDTMTTLSNLIPNTRYEIYVTANCTSGESDSTRHILVRTACEPETTLPLFYDFETHNTETMLPDCWQRNTTGSYTAPYTSTSYSYNGQRGLYLLAGANSMAVLPMVDSTLYPLQNLQVRFMARHNAYSANGVEVGVMTNPNDPASFVSVSSVSFPVDGSGAWEETELNLAGYTGPAGFVAIRSTNSSVYVDNLYLEEIPTCPRVQNITVTSLGGDEITLTWTGFNDNYLVRYREANDSVWNTTDAVVTGNTATISNLDATTTYRVEIAPDCEDTDENSYRGINFTTACNSFDIPYTIDFETPSDTDCWTVASQGYYYDDDDDYGGYEYYYPALRNYSSYAHSGTRYVAFASEQGETMVWAAPKMNANIEDLRLHFYVRKQSSSSYYVYGQLQVGVMTNPSDATSFVLVDSIEVSSTDYSLKYVDFDNANLSGDSYYIAFRYVGAGTSDYSTYVGEMYVDDITIMNIPTCAAPQHLQAANVAATSADIIWSSDGNAFNFYYKTSSDSVYTQVAGLSDTTYAMSGLTEQTIYSVYVARICEDGNESVSESVTFTTPCAAVAAPYTENFNAAGSMPTCWATCSGLAADVFNGTTSLTPNTSYWSFSNTNVFGQYHPRINIYGTSVKNWLITPDIDLSALTNPGLTFDLALTKYNTSNPIENDTAQQDDKFMVVISTDHGTTWSAVNATVWDNSGNGNHVFNQISSTGEEIAISLTQYAGQTIRIGFYGESSAADGDNDLHIDNVHVGEQASCPTPTQLTVTNITTTTADVAWTENGDATSWEVEYGIGGFTPGTGTTMTVSGTPAVTLSGLSASSFYNVYVKAVCSNGDYSNAAMKPFATACGSITSVPQNWDFENNLTAGTTGYPLPQCWDRTTSTYPYVNTTSYNSHSGNHILTFSNSTANSIAVMPDIDASALNINDLQVSFYAKISSVSNDVTLQVGMINDSLDAASFTPIEAIHLTSSYMEFPYEVSLANYTGSFTRVAFRNAVSSSNYSSIYIDDVMLTTLPSCSRPSSLTAFPASTSADLSWTSTGSNFNVYYKAESDTEYVEITNVGNPFYTLSALDPNTTYNWYVEAVCADTTLASNVRTFTTLCSAVVAPFFEDFNASSAKPSCWDTYRGYASEVFNGTPLEPYTSTNWYFNNTNVFGDYHAKINIYGTGIRYWLVTPDIDLSTLTNPSLMFDLALTKFNTSNPIESMTEQQDDKFIVAVSTDHGNTWTAANAVVWDNTGNGDYVYNQISATGEPVTISLSQFASQTIRIAFYGESTVSGGDNDLHIDNVVVDEMSNCPKPSGLTVTSVTSNSAVVAWTENGDATAWNIEYGPAGFAQGSGTTVNVTVNPYTLNSLNDATLYDIYVQAACSATEQSLWGGPASFRTECNTVSTFPYTEDFEFDLGCWNSDLVSGTKDWTQKTGAGANTGNGYAEFPYSGGVARLVSPVFDLTTLSDPYITYYHRQPEYEDYDYYDDNTVYQDSLAVYYRTSTTSEWVRIKGFSSDIPDYAFDSIVLPNPTASYQIAFVAYANDALGVQLDDITVNGGEIVVEPCDVPTGLHTTSIQNEAVTIAWDTNANVSSWNIRYRVVNTSSWSMGTSNTNSYTISGLTGLTNYEIQVQADCGDGNASDWSLPATVQTTNVGIENHLENSVLLFPNPAKEYVDIRINGELNVMQMEVYDVYGKLTNTVSVVENPTRINITSLANGMYFVRVTTEQGTVTKSFMKQ